MIIVCDVFSAVLQVLFNTHVRWADLTEEIVIC